MDSPTRTPARDLPTELREVSVLRITDPTAVGVVSSGRRGRAANQQAQQQAAATEAASHQATQEQTNNFKKAYSVCLEAKDYMVK